MLEKIFQYVEPLDRLSLGATWKRLDALISRSTLLDDVWLSIHGSGFDEAEPILMKSQRRYRNLRITRGEQAEHRSNDFSGDWNLIPPFVSSGDLTKCNHRFWDKVGRHLRQLEFIACDLESFAFHTILEYCPELETLEIKGHHDGKEWRLCSFKSRPWPQKPSPGVRIRACPETLAVPCEGQNLIRTKKSSFVHDRGFRPWNGFR